MRGLLSAVVEDPNLLYFDILSRQGELEGGRNWLKFKFMLIRAKYWACLIQTVTAEVTEVIYSTCSSSSDRVPPLAKKSPNLQMINK